MINLYDAIDSENWVILSVFFSFLLVKDLLILALLNLSKFGFFV